VEYALSQLTQTPILLWAVLGAGAVLWFAATWVFAANFFSRKPDGDPHDAATSAILSGFVLTALLVGLSTWFLFGNWVWTLAAALLLFLALAILWLSLVRPARATSSSRR